MPIRVFVLRHANADTIATVDDDRALSKKGRRQCKALAKFARRQQLQFDVILSSPVKRAKQTTKRFLNELEPAGFGVCSLVFDRSTDTLAFSCRRVCRLAGVRRRSCGRCQTAQSESSTFARRAKRVDCRS